MLALVLVGCEKEEGFYSKMEVVDLNKNVGNDLSKLSDFAGLEGTLKAVPAGYALKYPESGASTVVIYTNPSGEEAEIYAFDDFEDQSTFAESVCDENADVTEDEDGNKVLDCKDTGDECNSNADGSITICTADE